MRVAEIINDEIVLNEREKITLQDKTGAIVKVIGCGLCGSDIVKFREHISENGTVLGHEIVAEIVEINSKSGFKIGDKIVSSHHIPCFKCVYCKGESYSMCEHFKSTNIIPGGFSEYVYLSEEHLLNVVHLVPKNLSDVEVSFYEPLGCCIRAVKRAKLSPLSNVVVIGLGTIGLLMAQALKAYGMNVFACDIIDERIERAAKLGINSFNSSSVETAHNYIYSNTNNIGADCIFMTSGADTAIPLALETVRAGGKILVFASTPNNTGYANNEIYYRELTVLGSYSPRPKDLEISLKLLTDGEVKVKNLSVIYPIEKIQQAFDDTISNRIMKAYIKF
ncbi:MAG: alcohol dehydrogenase catalytic domain-containing protein [Candidatus Gastranaerophilales bacterium]|nr:alcohol dehydrogenase catalytic domain-containing protein [Candidatus Gastranaerophilales bacterium]